MITQLISEINTAKKEIRKFGLTLGPIIIIIGAILLWKNNIYYPIFMIIGCVLLACGMVIPVILKPIYFIWMIFANILGWVMTRVILFWLYYLIITPIGLIGRLFGKQFIELRWDKSNASYWNYRTGKTERVSYKKQF